MKKVLIIIGLILLIFPLVNVDSKINKIDLQVMQELDNEDTVQVFVVHSGEIDIEGKRHARENKFSIEVTLDELQKLETNELVESITKVREFELFLDVSVPLINTTPVWNTQFSNINLTGSGQTACILDTGADFTHPDLVGKNRTCVIDCTGASCVANCSLEDDNGHGTHVAGIIAASGGITGVAPNAGIIAVKVCNPSCAEDDIEAGINWCRTNSETYNISVISMSIGSNCTSSPSSCYSTYCNSDGLASSIDSATTNNISVIIATGNNGNQTHISSPSCIESAIAVGATTGSGNISTYSNRNNLVDLVAPGNNINSTYTPAPYDSLSGTSMATPHVSGAFLLMNQMRNLEGNSKLTPSQLVNAFNLTADNIDDTGYSAWNYSRVDIYAAALNLDSKAPTINLVSPSNTNQSSLLNQTFECNSTDELQLANLSIIVWNSTGGVVNETNSTAQNNSLELSMNSTLSAGDYTWSCFGYDKNSNYAIASNYSLTIEDFYVTLDLPLNNTYTSINETNFTCSFGTNNTLSNVTFYLWNSTGNLIYNETTNVSGTQNTSTYNYTLNETNYSWNCLVKDDASQSNFSSNNFTRTYDSINPVVNLTSPADSHSTTSTSIEFVYNFTETNIANCSLILDDLVSITNSSLTQGQNSFTSTLGAASYNWKINCIDLAGNSFNSSSRTLTITSSVTTSLGGSSPSTGPSSAPGTPIELEYDLSKEELKQGVKKTLQKSDSLTFELKNESHNLTVERVLPDSVELIIYSEPIKVSLVVGQIKKLNLNNDEFYDLFLKLDSINFPLANITIKEIHEEIPVYTLLDEEENLEKIKWFTGEKIIGLGIISIVILIIFISYLFIRFRNKKTPLGVLQSEKSKGKKDIW